MVSHLRVFLLALAALLLFGGTAPAVDVDPVFKIYVEHAGVYELSFDRLAEAGLGSPLPTGKIGLRNFGEPVPIWVDDGGDGHFDPGDRLTFMGEVLRGDYSYLDPYSRFNCYVLDFGDSEPWHGESRPSDGPSSGKPTVLGTRHHLESDRVMVRFRQYKDRPEESWYWQRLSMVDKAPFRHELVVDGLARRPDSRGSPDTYADALSELVRERLDGKIGVGEDIRSRVDALFGGSPDETTARLRIGFRGWSEPRHAERQTMPHHEVSISLNGSEVSRAIWDGKEHYIAEIEISPKIVVEGVNELSLSVPKRRYPASGDLVVDVVLLNWIEVEYEHIPVVGDEQLRVYPTAGAGFHRVEIGAADGDPVDLYLPAGLRYRGRTGLISTGLEVGADGFSVLRPAAAAAPGEVVFDRPSSLAAPESQADYIMITHRSLRDSAETLAEFHRGRGLLVALVDVQDIYDEFNHGVLNPKAIKDFLQYANQHWQTPAPRFVLLVGDASWDFKNTTADDANYADWTYRAGEARRFVKNSSTPYAEGAELNHRNLVPTWSFPTLEGHAASDTWFVCFDDGDELPDMAIGRLPVANSEELDTVVRKTVAFADALPVGPWRRNLLFIANESASFQRRSDEIAEEFSSRGYVPIRIYPHPSEPANEHHTRRIVELFDGGLQAVHFIGHGGRYIWRTGPPDLEKNHDLFTLDHLDELAENSRLPMVLSLTCYSAPFDHPTADSIGEKLVRIADRGAIAVFAASWRNSPSPTMGRVLLEELTTPGNTIGESIMRAKRDFRSNVLIQTYNLLGDPAVGVGAPGHVLGLDLDDGENGLTLRLEMPVPLGDGRLIVEWLGEDGSVLREDLLEVTGSVFEITVSPAALGDESPLAGIRAYAWDDENRIDGIGGLDVAVEEATGTSASGDRARDGNLQVDSRRERETMEER